MAEGTSPAPVAVHAHTGLIQLVGYRELVKAAGVSRSTIERAWRGPWDPDEPRLPKPGKIGSRAVWALEVANAWLMARARWQCGQVQTLAQAVPDDLAPAEIVVTIASLAARVLSEDLGRPIDPDHVHIRAHVHPPLTEDELAACEERECLILEQRYAHFDRDRAALAAAFLFPVLRPYFAEATPEHARAIFASTEKLRHLGYAAFDDDAWQEIEAEIDRTRRSESR